MMSWATMNWATMNWALDRAIVRAGAPGGIRFTRRQLWFELARVMQPWHALPRRPGFRLGTPVSYARFEAMLARRAPLAPDPVYRCDSSGIPDEVFEYGLPRLLVCTDTSIAAMLRANDLHLESACPVYAVADLPLDPRLRSALADGTVYVLHDATEAGYARIEAVRAWAGDVPVDPLGLRAEHVSALHLPGAEVSAVNPARLLRTVHRLVRGFGRVRPRVRLRQVPATGFLSWPTS